MKDNDAQPAAGDADSPSAWVKTPVANLVRYKPSGTYFARVRIQGKLFRHALITTVMSVAKLRLSDFLTEELEAIGDDKAVEMPRITHHDLRHLFATRCIESGVDIPTVSR